uniref:Toll-like receptor 3 n=1 Tax=Phallusia mammillata TaxID=59560 RepID=A0A6F9DVC6_9ASCI|nr:toll-like receptor 3 [Phallusia mammillata]
MTLICHGTQKKTCVAMVTLLTLLLHVLFASSTFANKNARQKRQAVVSRRSVCPDECKCTVEEDGRKFAKCANRNKKTIPIKIPIDVAVIDLGGNKITEIKAGYLDGLTLLKELDLSYNPLTKIEPTAMRQLGRLTRLDLSFTKLKNLTLSDLGESARSLEVLILSNTDIRHFPKLHDEEGGFMTNLKVLDVSSNFFPKIPRDYIPSSVEELDLSCLEMIKLPAIFGNLQKLRKLTINGCNAQKTKLTYVGRRAFADLPELQILDLSHNFINTIPDILPMNLISLDLSDNRITRIKTSRCASQLEIRDNYNVIPVDDNTDASSSRLGSSLSRLTILKNLTLARNQIETICSDDFMFMDSLQSIDLSYGRVTSFPLDAFLYPESLKKLDLSYNFIRNLAMGQMLELEEFYLQGNYIETVDQITVGTFPALTRADLSNNRFECDCKLKLFITFIKYKPQGIFDYLHPNSVQYVCAGPRKYSGTNLLALDEVSDLTCDDDENTFPYWAIAAPLSLVGLVILIVVVICVMRVRAGERVCCYGKNENKKKKVVSQYSKYDSDIIIQDSELNDAAILCHTENHKWVLNTMMPKLQRNMQQSQNACDDSVSQAPNRPLNFEVFTIGKTIKIDTLHNCIDYNRKIALVVTNEFLKEKSCLYILQVVQERMIMDPKDAVVVVMLDAIAWSDLPANLQRLMTEKTFVQFPQRDRERQEFYFWESMCSLICTTDPTYENKCVTEADDEELRDDVTVASTQYKPRPLARDCAEVEFGTIRSSRRARSIHDELPRVPLSATRAARLQRLGITSKGEVADDAMNEVTEARNLAKRHYRMKDISVVSNSSLDGVQSPPPSAIGGHSNHLSRHTSHNLETDIDDLYHTRKEPRRNGKTGRVRSLLPPNEDAASIYSDDVEVPVPGYEVRPPERDRPKPEVSRHPSRHHRQRRHSTSESIKSRGASTKGSRRSSVTHDDVIENLHGTVDRQYENQVATSTVGRSEITDVSSQAGAEEEQEQKEPGRIRGFFGRLKSLF